jgi:hypothetical protein
MWTYADRRDRLMAGIGIFRTTNGVVDKVTFRARGVQSVPSQDSDLK